MAAPDIICGRLEWDILNDVGVDGQVHQSMTFTDPDFFNSYRRTLHEAAKEGMCENITAFSRSVTITLGEWSEMTDQVEGWRPQQEATA